MRDAEPILIVDDEEGLRYVLSRQLQQAGYEVETACDGQEAVEKMAQREYAVVITDMKMPRLDGLGLIQKAHEILPEAEIVVLSGHGSLENAVAAFKLGNVFEYLLKPLEDIALLNAVVERALERRRFRRYNRQLFEQLQQAYEALKVKTEQLVQAEKLSTIGQLSAGVAHELNNPLTAVLGFAEYLQEKLKDFPNHLPTAQESERIQEALRHIVAGAHRCRDTVQTLLRFARATQQDHRFEIDIHTVLKDVFVFTEHLLLRRGITLVKELEPNLPPIWGNPGRLQQVFTNLILNACQATPDGGTVLVRAEASPQPWGVLIKVEDTGSGIPPEHLERIFEPFFTTKPEGVGTGLGLSIVAQIVQEHRGRIEVESEVGKGTRFFVFLPAYDQEEPLPLPEAA